MMSVARPLVIDRQRVEDHLPNLPMLVALALVLAALLSLLYLAQTSGVAITGYDVQELEAQRALWQVGNDQLRLRIAEARSLDRVEREARLRVGMGPPERVVFVRQPVVESRPEPARSDSGLGRALAVIQRSADGALAWLQETF